MTFMNERTGAKVSFPNVGKHRNLLIVNFYDYTPGLGSVFRPETVIVRLHGDYFERLELMDGWKETVN